MVYIEQNWEKQCQEQYQAVINKGLLPELRYLSDLSKYLGNQLFPW